MTRPALAVVADDLTEDGEAIATGIRALLETKEWHVSAESDLGTSTALLVGLGKDPEVGAVAKLAVLAGRWLESRGSKRVVFCGLGAPKSECMSPVWSAVMGNKHGPTLIQHKSVDAVCAELNAHLDRFALAEPAFRQEHEHKIHQTLLEKADPAATNTSEPTSLDEPEQRLALLAAELLRMTRAHWETLGVTRLLAELAWSCEELLRQFPNEDHERQILDASLAIKLRDPAVEVGNAVRELYAFAKEYLERKAMAPTFRAPWRRLKRYLGHRIEHFDTWMTGNDPDTKAVRDAVEREMTPFDRKFLEVHLSRFIAHLRNIFTNRLVANSPVNIVARGSIEPTEAPGQLKRLREVTVAMSEYAGAAEIALRTMNHSYFDKTREILGDQLAEVADVSDLIEKVVGLVDALPHNANPHGPSPRLWTPPPEPKEQANEATQP